MNDFPTVSPLPGDFDPDAEAEAEGVFGLPASPAAKLVMLAVPWEATVSYRSGTAGGPQAILLASRQVELYDRRFGHPYRHGIAWVEPDRAILDWHAQARQARDEGDLAAVDRLCRQLHEQMADATRQWRRQGKLVAVVGGEHGVSLGALAAVAAEGEPLGLLQIDAHADLRESYQGCRFSHACFAARAMEVSEQVTQVVQIGVRDLSAAEARRIDDDRRVTAYFDQRLEMDLLDRIVRGLPQRVWISWDIDGLEPALCPHTGTPVPGGLNWREAVALLEAVERSGRQIVGFDLCEVAPGSETPGAGIDEVVAARLLYKLCGAALAAH